MRPRRPRARGTGRCRKRLKDAERTIGNFLEVARRLEEHLGPILVQLPPGWRAHAVRDAADLRRIVRRRCGASGPGADPE